MFRATWKEENSTSTSKDESTPDLIVSGRIQKREHESNYQTYYKDTPTNSDSTVDDESKNSKKSINILSPHDSVYQALNDPSLNSNILSGKTGLTKERLRLLDADPVNGAQFQLSFTKSSMKNVEETNNLDFSITSWQNISTYFDKPIDEHPSSSKIQIKTPLTLSTDQVNIISSGNNSPTYKTDEILGLGPNRTESPNAGSILSSSSGQEEEKTIEKILDQNNAVKRSKSMFEKRKKRELLSDDDESIDTDLERTVDSSTVTSSFVMPKVSILSKSTTDVDYFKIKSITKVKIVGDNNERLLKRFQNYKKTLTQIEFISSIDENADLIIIIVDENNYMLPKLTNTYCIPIILSKSKLHLVRKIPKAFKLCEPIQLSSLNDNLLQLVTFLSNINNVQFWKSYVSSVDNTRTSNTFTISDLNTSIVGFQSKASNGQETRVNNSENSDKKEKAEGLDFSTYVAVTLAVGTISMGVLMFIRTLTNENFPLTNVEQSDPNLLKPADIKTGKQIIERLNDYLVVGLKHFQHNLNEGFSQFFSKSLLYYHKTKLLLYQYFNF